jgi:hypothetical protein
MEAEAVAVIGAVPVVDIQNLIQWVVEVAGLDLVEPHHF